LDILLNAVAVVNPDCALSNGSVAVYPSGGVAPYNFLWDAATGNQTNDTAVALPGGIYSVTVTDAQGCSKDVSVGLSTNFNSTSVYLNWSTDPSCLYGSGYIDMEFFGGFGPFTYQWSTGETTQDIFVNEGGKYVFALTDVGLGCVNTYDNYLMQWLPQSPELCMVTVDSTNSHNVVVFDKTNNPDADYFKIYREGFCNNTDFGWVGSVDADSLSAFNDTVVNTDTRTWKYYVTAVDTCGYESSASDVHRTIHLSASLNGNNNVLLQWSEYVGEQVLTYEIYRKQPLVNVFDLVDTVAGFLVSYTDTSNLAAYNSDTLVYYIEAIPASLCYASRAFNQNAARSNRSSLTGQFDTTSVTELYNAEHIMVYPNPTNDVLNILINGGNGGLYQVDIMNAVGQVVTSAAVNRQVALSTRNLNAGIYFVSIRQENKLIKASKVIVTR
jgi:hypothetical protein